jgi:hypothetical protein
VNICKFKDHQKVNLNSTSLKTSYRWQYVPSESVWWLITYIILLNANITYLVSHNRLIIYAYKIPFLACGEYGRMPFKYDSKSAHFRKILKVVGHFRHCKWQSTNIAVFWDVITRRLSEIYCRFLGVCSFHFQGRRLSSRVRISCEIWIHKSVECAHCLLGCEKAAFSEMSLSV